MRAATMASSLNMIVYKKMLQSVICVHLNFVRNVGGLTIVEIAVMQHKVSSETNFYSQLVQDAREIYKEIKDVII